MRKIKINQDISRFKVVASNSSCDCGSGTGSTGYHSPAARKVTRFFKKTYRQSRLVENQRMAA